MRFGGSCADWCEMVRSPYPQYARLSDRLYTSGIALPGLDRTYQRSEHSHSLLTSGRPYVLVGVEFCVLGTKEKLGICYSLCRHVGRQSARNDPDGGTAGDGAVFFLRPGP